VLNFKNIILFACFSKIIVIFVPLNFKNINDMKNFIELKDSDDKSVLVNVNQIVAIQNTEEGIIMHMVGGYDVFPKYDNWLQLKHMIEES
jgi:hypothetical protein